MPEINFSIIIPVYNTKQYIGRAVKSVLNQNCDKTEIILVDDGSTDGSDTVIKNLIEEYPNHQIKYIYKDNGGLSSARNIGFHYAKGDYIVWLDSDDAMISGSLKVIEAIIAQKPDVIVNRISCYDEKTKNITECSFVFNDERIMSRACFVKTIKKTKGFWYAAWCFIARRDFLIRTGLSFMDGFFHEDELWCAKLICLADSFYLNNKSIYLNTTLREGSIISTKNIKKEFDKLLICKELKEMLKTSPKECLSFLKRRIILLLFSVFLGLKAFKNDESFEELELEYFKSMRSIYGILSFSYQTLFFVRSLV